MADSWLKKNLPQHSSQSKNGTLFTLLPLRFCILHKNMCAMLFAIAHFLVRVSVEVLNFKSIACPILLECYRLFGFWLFLCFINRCFAEVFENLDNLLVFDGVACFGKNMVFLLPKTYCTCQRFPFFHFPPLIWTRIRFVWTTSWESPVFHHIRK